MLHEVLLSVGLLVVVAKVAEGLLGRFGLNSIVAYALAGMLLGPLSGAIEPSGELQIFLSIGVFLLFFIVGLDEIDVPGFVATIRGRYFLAAIISVVVSLAAALLVTSNLLSFDFVLGLEFGAALALAGILSLSSLGLVAKVLSDGGHLKDPIGLKMFTVVIIAEILALLVVGFSIGEHGHELNAVGILSLLGQIVGFVLIAWILSARVLPPLISFLQTFLNVPQLSFGLLIGGLFLVVVAAENFGLHGTIGALMFGTALSGLPHKVRVDIMPGMRSASEGLFVPLFFASAGLNFDLSFAELPAATIAALVVVPFIGKFLGAVLGVTIARIDTPMALSAGLMAKGVAEIALLLVLFDHHMIDRAVFSLLVLVMLGYMLMGPGAIVFTLKQAKVSDSAVLPPSVPPSFARYAMADVKARTVLDATRDYPNSTTTVQGLMEDWTVPNQHDYLVVDDGEIAGIVSMIRLRLIPRGSWATTPLGEVLRQHTPQAHPEEPIDDVLERMTNHSLTVIPVVDPHSSRFLGTVTSHDVLDFIVLMDEIEMELERRSENSTD